MDYPFAANTTCQRCVNVDASVIPRPALATENTCRSDSGPKAAFRPCSRADAPPFSLWKRRVAMGGRVVMGGRR